MAILSSQLTNMTGNLHLLQKLLARIEGEGPMTFAEFMEANLYDPQYGYYSSAARIGPDGDYWTSPEVHPIFARLIGQQIADLADAIAPSGEFTIVEMGAGQGTFAGHLLSAYQRDFPGLLARLRYIIIERAAGLIQRQQQHLRPLLEKGSQIQWLPNVADLAANSITGVMCSNELVDAFPVHRVVMRPLGLREIFVGWSQDRFIEIEAPPSAPLLEQYFERLGLRLRDGQRAEVNLCALDWIRQVGSRLRKGLVCTVDYGHSAADLFAPARNAGTLLCYYRQSVSDTPYCRIGQQDITAHVDFTSLALAGQEAGLEVTGFTNQLHFLMGLGIESAFAGIDPESNESGWMRKLLRPDGMGTTFKVLVQHKGMPAPALAGLRSRPFFVDALYAGLPEHSTPLGAASNTR